MAFQNGSIRVYLLTDKKDFGRLGPHWTGWAHDQDYGDISSIAFSYDDRYVFSTGLDGNFLVFQTAETAKFMFGAQGVQPEIIPEMTVHVSDADPSQAAFKLIPVPVYRVVQKTVPQFYFCDNFRKYTPILTIFHC